MPRGFERGKSHNEYPILPNQSAELGALHSCSGGRSLLTGSRGGSPDKPSVRVLRIAVRTIRALRAVSGFSGASAGSSPSSEIVQPAAEHSMKASAPKGVLPCP